MDKEIKGPRAGGGERRSWMDGWMDICMYDQN